MDGANRSAEVPVHIDVIGLVRVLLGPSTEEQRYDWARYLLLQAQISDSDLHHLFHSFHKRGAHWQRELHQLRMSVGHPSSPSEALAEREELASDLAELAAQWAQLSKLHARDETADRVSEQTAKRVGAGLVGEDELHGLHDVLRRAPTTAAPRAAPKLEEAMAADSLRLCRPTWQAGAEPKLVQAVLRFEPPGVEAGERVIVEGPGGEQLTLVVPSGVMHVQRALACVNRNTLSKSDNFLQLDIVPLPFDVAPGGRIEVAGVAFVLPQNAVPGSSLCVALPTNSGSSARHKART
ncbi:hypothetical protein AB1Y20_019271 [Prymnesium parvum]|uniref:Uncharacterized protein n=1 Tax=Prymnesium parvum TaxID=97485 RepID=A0AB34JS93_PRYPA